ncbi:MAG: glycine cleavage system protein H [Deltaproteobacteria bacterium]|nr:glycine cleavage system protein H [Deltaproteobacteria bacterium]
MHGGGEKAAPPAPKKFLPKNFFNEYIPQRLPCTRRQKRTAMGIGEVRFSRDHMWVRLDDEIRVTLGLTDYLQEKMGEIYSLRLPDEGEELIKDEVFSALEAQNGRRELISPVSGEVVDLNYEAMEVPEIINEDPLSEGWLLKVELPSLQEFEDLLSEEEYEEYLSEEGLEED